ncbi:MAG: protein phosphatase 2C domain-containing protein [Gammaproteobacteria bacterium]|nr:protein phosphatase 2C domain-containing protein [Gammaproteobacteria bacterium]MCP5196160.1 protein phosphatase 2C domain-containing protein [Gammaproteobacteria bacterium]
MSLKSSIQPSSPSTPWEQGAASHQGGRHEQQDRWGLFQSHNPAGLLAIVADGMGGHLDGALGAQIVIDTAQNFVLNPPASLQTDPSTALEQLCQQMHETINRRSETARSTLIMVWLAPTRAYWLNIGDSRLYHFRQGHRVMRTRDHSVVQLLTDLGEIEESQMGMHPAQNRLYRCLGGDESPRSDQGDLTIQPGDLLALCSDGVWEHVTETEIWTITLDHGPEAAAHRLVETAAQRGGADADNATLVLLRTDPDVISDPPRWLNWLPAGLTSLFNRDRRS